MRLLLTNDDGYDSPGINVLYQALSARHEVIVAAPRTQQSGIGHAFTFNTPLYYEPIPSTESCRGFIINGTPSDCVKFAVSHLLSDRPHAVVSGINLGENSGMSGHYSGTVAAAREGAFWRIPSVAFSMCGTEHIAGYAAAAARILEHLTALGANGSNPGRRGVFFNVNFPDCAPSRCRGIKVTRQSMAFFDDRYREKIDNEGRPGFWIYGEKANLEDSEEYDSRALINGFITVTPLDYDSTAHHALTELMPLERLFAQGEDSHV